MRWRRWRGLLIAAAVAALLAVTLGAATLSAFTPRVVEPTNVEPVPADAQPVTVIQVLAGDTVIVGVERPGPTLPVVGEITVKLIGVDAPNFGLIDECFAVESEGRLTQLIPESTIAWIKTDTLTKDPNGRWLAYLWAGDGRFVNYLLTVDGFARAEAGPPNLALFEQIEVGQARAAARFGGLWGQCR